MIHLRHTEEIRARCSPKAQESNFQSDALELRFFRCRRASADRRGRAGRTMRPMIDSRIASCGGHRRARAQFSSSASRSSAAAGLVSPVSILPPGNEICPAWSPRWAVRPVNSTIGSASTAAVRLGGAAEMAATTAVCVGISISRDDVWIGEPIRHIEREARRCKREELGRGEKANRFVVRCRSSHSLIVVPPYCSAPLR
jgi:hypothetical protein